MAPDAHPSAVHAIVGGTVIDPAGGTHAQLNVFIEHGAIIDKSSRKPTTNVGIIDARGCIVAPGFIDMHVHLREPGQEYKEDIASGTEAAAAGGFTTVCCMPNTDPVNDSAEVTRGILARVRDVAPIAVLPVAALTVGSRGQEPVDIPALQEAGAGAFSDDGTCIQDDALMKRVLEQAAHQGALVIDHAEDFSQTGKGRVNEGKAAKRMGVAGIPREAENAIIRRDIDLARQTHARVHIAHLSTREGVQAIREAKADGISITCEVTPHHLLLNEDDVERYGPLAIMKPPLRTEEDRQALVAGLADGTIDAIATDHAPHAADEKRDAATAAFGIIGMETMLPVCLGLVHEGQLTMERFIDAVSCAPARILSLGERGSLKRKSAADITVFDPDVDVTIDASTFRSKARNTPFDGWRCKGRVRYTIAGGCIAYAAPSS